jgi:acyl-CoA thioesterase I
MRIRSRWFSLAAMAFLAAACSPGPVPDGQEAGLEPPPEVEGSGASTGKEAGAATASRPPLVVFVGTSLTEGFGLSDPGEEAWPARVAARAAGEGLILRFRNAGLSGETSAGALRRIDWVMDEPPAVLILEAGANDGLRGLPVAQMEANLDAILGRIREIAPEARVVLVGMEAPPNLGTGYAREFREVYPRVARRWGTELIPFLLEGVAGVPGLNQPDRIHPTSDGHDRMAEVAWPVLAPLLREAAERAPGGAANVPR